MATDEKSRFNFTLRELLLAMVAVGALLALAVKSYERAQPFVTTGFYQLLDGAKSQTIVAASGQRLGVNVKSLGAGASESSGGKSASRELRLTIRAPLEYPGLLLGELQRESQQMLEQDECSVLSSGGASEGTKRNITQFSFDYEKGATRGHVFVHRVPTSEDSWQLFILIHEFEK